MVSISDLPVTFMAHGTSFVSSAHVSTCVCWLGLRGHPYRYRNDKLRFANWGQQLQISYFLFYFDNLKFYLCQFWTWNSNSKSEYLAILPSLYRLQYIRDVLQYLRRRNITGWGVSSMTSYCVIVLYRSTVFGFRFSVFGSAVPLRLTVTDIDKRSSARILDTLAVFR